MQDKKIFIQYMHSQKKKLINGYIGCSTVAFFMPCYWKCNPNVRLLVGRLVIRSVCHNFHAGIGAFVEFVTSLWMSVCWYDGWSVVRFVKFSNWAKSHTSMLLWARTCYTYDLFSPIKRSNITSNMGPRQLFVSIFSTIGHRWKLRQVDHQYSEILPFNGCKSIS